MICGFGFFMLLRLIQILFVFAIAFAGASVAVAQSADNQTNIFAKPGDEDRPKSLKETLDKMRIEQEKKEYKEMLGRGDEALKITEELEKTVEKNGKLTDRDMAKVASVEKLVKKIRSELGGADDDGDDEDKPAVPTGKLTALDAVKSLKTSTASLIDELQKTTRFSISAAAIQSTNTVLRIARYLRIAN